MPRKIHHQTIPNSSAPRPLKPQLKAVLFDMDDTLLDWSQRVGEWGNYERAHLHRIYDYVTSAVGTPSAPLDRLHDEVRQRSKQSWMDAEVTLRAPSYVEALLGGLEAIGIARHKVDVRACLEAYEWGNAEGVRLFPDVPAVLGLLNEHGIKVGLVTNASVPMWMRDRELAQHDLLKYFGDCRLTAADVGYIKPHPAIFEAALSRLGDPPQNVVFVGDNPAADISGAQRAGMRAVLRDVGYHSPLILMGEIVPDGTLKSLAELPALLDSWYPAWRAGNGR